MILKPPQFIQLNKGHPMSRGLVGCWLMNEASGVVAFDSSGHNNKGTLESDTHFVAGKHGSALDFDGAGDYVECANSNSLDITDVLTMVACFKTDITATYQRIFDKGWDRYTMGLTPHEDGRGFHVSYRNQLGDAHVVYSSGFVYSMNTWYQVAGVIDSLAKSCKIYINGVLNTQEDFVGTSIKSTSDPVRLGTQVSQSYLNGQIDFALIWNRALTPQEILILFNNPFEMFEPEPIELWSAANPAGGQTILDYERATRGVNRGLARGVA